jgi:hypothetical protein
VLFELKSKVKKHAPQHFLHALRGGGRVVGAKAHIYTYISNARFRFSFAIERERLTVTRRTTTTIRRKYASRNVRENAPGLSDV